MIDEDASKSQNSSRVALNHGSGAHAGADAHRHDAIAGLAAAEFGQDSGSQACASAAQGMAKGNRATIRVHLRRVSKSRRSNIAQLTVAQREYLLDGDAELLDAVSCLRCERLVDLKDVDVVQSETSLLNCELKSAKPRIE